MPQMFSLNWLMLSFYFLIIMYLYMSLIYFNYSNVKSDMLKTKITNEKKYWLKCW